jgi:hypothetical protein
MSNKTEIKVKTRIDKVTGEPVLFFADHPKYAKDQVRIMSWKDKPFKDGASHTRHKVRDMEYYHSQTRNPSHRGEVARVNRLLATYKETTNNDLVIMERLKTKTGVRAGTAKNQTKKKVV